MLYVYRLYHQSVSLNVFFVFLRTASDTADATTQPHNIYQYIYIYVHIHVRSGMITIINFCLQSNLVGNIIENKPNEKWVTWSYDILWREVGCLLRQPREFDTGFQQNPGLWWVVLTWCSCCCKNIRNIYYIYTYYLVGSRMWSSYDITWPDFFIFHVIYRNVLFNQVGCSKLQYDGQWSYSQNLSDL